MPITFIPGPGTVLLCDYSTGFVPPEMVKARPVVVVSPRPRRGGGTCVVVPFSNTPPDPITPAHVRIPANKYVFFKPGVDTWAKADMVTAVAYSRLDRLIVQGRYTAVTLHPDDLLLIQRAVVNALGLGHLLHGV